MMNDQWKDTGPQPLMQQFSPPKSDPRAVIAPEAIALIAEARLHSNTAPLLFDRRAVMPRVRPGLAWTTANNIANYSALPRSMGKIYIARGAKTFHRNGWLIVEDGEYDDWPSTFATAYVVCRMRRLGHYTAYTLSPRTGGSVQQKVDGAGCSDDRQHR